MEPKGGTDTRPEPEGKKVEGDLMENIMCRRQCVKELAKVRQRSAEQEQARELRKSAQKQCGHCQYCIGKHLHRHWNLHTLLHRHAHLHTLSSPQSLTSAHSLSSTDTGICTLPLLHRHAHLHTPSPLQALTSAHPFPVHFIRVTTQMFCGYEGHRRVNG